jgi:hypothetical protein
MPPQLCFVLVSRARTHVWCGPGMRPWKTVALADVKYWTERKLASQAARALRAAIRLEVVVCPVYLPRT